MKFRLALLAMLTLCGVGLSAYSADNSVVKLQGPWDFRPNALLEADSPEWIGATLSIKLPQSWNSLYWSSKPAGQADGYGSYRIWLDLPNTGEAWAMDWGLVGSASKIIWQGKTIHHAGTIGTTKQSETPGNSPGMVVLANGNGWLIIQVSNFHHVDGGLWSPIRLGPLHLLEKSLRSSAGVEWFLAGAFIILGLLGFGIVLVLSREKASLWFGLLTLVLGIRILFHGQMNILQIFPAFDWEMFNKVRHITMYLLPVTLLRFLNILMPRRFKSWFIWAVTGISLLGVALVSILPYRVFGDFLYIYAAILLVQIGFVLWALIRAIRPDNPVVLWTVSGAIIIISATIVEIIHFVFLTEMPSLLPFATLLMLICLALSLGLHLGRTQVAHEKLGRQYSGIKHSLERFFPKEFLSLLKRDSLADLELGQAISAEMAVLFADIRSFTSKTQNMEPENIFRLVNSFLGLMGPIIRKNGGFVDKYLGDGIMAIFPTGGAAAVQAAVDMHAAIPGVNAIHRVDELPELDIGIGIHQGPLLLGTIGEAERMDSTVISSVVNLTSRLESLTRDYRTPIIVSPEIIMSLPPDSEIDYRFLGHEHIRGFDAPQPIFEIFTPDPINIREQKIRSKAELEDALIHFSKSEFREAAHILLKLRQHYPDDPAPATYLKRIKDIQEKRLVYRINRQRAEMVTKTKSKPVQAEPDEVETLR